MTFGQALGRSLDIDAIRDVALQHLDGLIGTRDSRVVAVVAGQWRMLVGNTRIARDPADVIQELTDRAKRDQANEWELLPIPADGSRWWPMTAGGELVGFLGVPEVGWDPGEAHNRMLATAATLLGVSLRNADLFRAVRESSLKDGLTGCFNRTHGLEVLDTELRRARRSKLPVSLIMFDIDRFKGINDRYGHLCGDEVLAATGRTMQEVLRGSDVKCRYGGEEFLVVLPDTPVEGALRVADTLRRELAERRIPWSNLTIDITASFGVAVAKPAEIDVTAFIGRADMALYRAKEQGRNCVILSTEPAVA
jgi:diguanylate cyclase (GGDEF)-like protein